MPLIPVKAKEHQAERENEKDDQTCFMQFRLFHLRFDLKYRSSTVSLDLWEIKLKSMGRQDVILTGLKKSERIGQLVAACRQRRSRPGDVVVENFRLAEQPPTKTF